jgi:hypothetical protein
MFSLLADKTGRGTGDRRTSFVFRRRARLHRISLLSLRLRAETPDVPKDHIPGGLANGYYSVIPVIRGKTIINTQEAHTQSYDPTIGIRTRF